VKQRVVGVIGLGLIGGSIAKRARKDGALVVGYDTDSGARAAALEVGAIDFAATRDELYARANTVVLATYAAGVVEELARLKKEGPIRASLVMDVASVKEPIVRAADGVANFVATHPMAGTEKSGVRNAKPDLFERKTWAYVPSGDARLDNKARAFIGTLGAVPLLVDAEEHDRIVGFTSHLPQLLATAYARCADEIRGEAFDALTGATSRELLRLGSSEFGFWRDVFAANARNVEPPLRELARLLTAAADALSTGQTQALADNFGRKVPQ
jgi:prephenate dehydrogenase